MSKFYLAFVLSYYFFRFTLGWFQNNFLYLHFIDVSQGDAIFIEDNINKTTTLIDGGPNYAVDYFLFRRRFFCNLDNVVVSHPHADHIIGLNKVLKRCNIKNIYLNSFDYQSKYLQEFLDLSTNLKISSLNHLNQFFSKNKQAKFIALNNYSKGGDNLNNESIILLFVFNKFTALFLGDAEVEALAALDLNLLKNLTAPNLVIIKTSHHGADNGLYKPLYYATLPKVAVISSGKNNKYNHPHPQVLQFLQQQKITTYRTDLLGNITFKIDRNGNKR